MIGRVRTNGVEIAYESFGSQEGRPLLLIMGLGSQLIHWDEDFCGSLVDLGHYVVRFDNRDAGESTHFHEAGMPDLAAALGGQVDAAYLLTDMAADVIGLLDALDLANVHLVGVSMGGMIAQTIAVAAPERVRSLTSIMSTPAPHIGAPTPEALGALLSPPVGNREAAIERALQAWSLMGSKGYPMDVERIARVTGLAYDRAYDPAGTARQLMAVLASGDRSEGLRGLDVPALVIHGEDDLLIQLPGGVATAEAIPGAKLLTFPGMGHDLPRDLWPVITDAIAGLTALAEREAAV
ncbi:Pimeloyl-ACP methyl ester carboxylesterase [Sinosporangium album]|uniref:Pimeloyl-ACP methyl ester carboxylesterase n=1 Tax=Sinosporangium album TaxID=504805 RepID=A0A1G8C4U1_9ACTN|nr:alpha/beta hydrolase [Sinosporangium album]SDH40405.1 Pimeloyl-ACP methyl ester carboxylesterase [Sinosporangium album]